MGCELNPKIVYVEFTNVVRKQKEILKKLVEKKQEQIRKVHSGLTCFKEGVREISVESIPGILETGWEPPSGMSRYKIILLNINTNDLISFSSELPGPMMKRLILINFTML